MADIRCSHCGKNNPDFLDVCQFCQSPLKPESMVHIGEEPTKKDTGELENILPDWLRDARQQGKDEKEADDAFRSQTKPKIPKVEPPDLLAGLMSQSDSDEDEVPDWLAGMGPAADKESRKPPSKDEGKPSDFFSQFRQAETQPPAPAAREPAQEETPAWMGMDEKPTEQKEDLTDWFPKSPAEATAKDTGFGASDDNRWLGEFGAGNAAQQPVEKEPEDLSWLHDLEAASKGTGELSLPKQDEGFGFSSSSTEEDLTWLNNLGGPSSSPKESAPSRPASSDEDLSWLNNLGGATPSLEEPASTQSVSPDEDLSWLNNLGGTPVSSNEPAPSQSASSDEDLSWLNNLGGVPVSEEPTPSQPSSSGEDLSWLKDFGGTPAASEEPVSSQQANFQEGPDWLNSLSGTPESAETTAPAFAEEGKPRESGKPEGIPSKPFRTAPLNELLGDEGIKDTTPDWLKNAMEEPSMPAPGAVSMDWFSEHDKQAGVESGEPGAQAQGEPGSSQPAFDFSMGDSSIPSGQDVDALFMEMPDWLSREPEAAETSQPKATAESTSADETLSPVELPSWVQAMRPVDSAIRDTAAADTLDQITEREGPLAGFRGVIPSAPIGSSLRPKAFSLKLQTTEDPQPNATLPEQIIAGETMVQPQKEVRNVSSQKVLRWVLSGLFVIVLGLVLGLGLQTIPIAGSNQLSDLVGSIPESSPVLVVIDYEPSFTGELEAAAGPLLDQLALSRHSTFTFVAMSPNGSALADHLLFTTGVSKPGGLGYQAGEQYFNLGFLPGGSAGVLGFIENAENELSKFEAVILMTDDAETGRVWVEQLHVAKENDQDIANKPLIVVSSAQSGPLLQPYVSSGQVELMVNGLYDAANYEYVNNTRPGIARSYWDAFGYGLMMAIAAIFLGSLWSVVMRIRERRAEAEQG